MATESTREPEVRAATDDSSASCAVCEIRAARGEEEDPWPRAGCKLCAARAAALSRIRAAGGDPARAAADSASRARGDVCVVEAIPLDTAMPRRGIRVVPEGQPRPTGVVRKTIRVPEAHIQQLLTDPRHTPLLPLSEDFVRRNPHLREPLLAAAAAVLSSIAKTGNILLQFFRKGFAVMEVEVDYDYQP